MCNPSYIVKICGITDEDVLQLQRVTELFFNTPNGFTYHDLTHIKALAVDQVLTIQRRGNYVRVRRVK